MGLSWGGRMRQELQVLSLMEHSPTACKRGGRGGTGSLC